MRLSRTSRLAEADGFIPAFYDGNTLRGRRGQYYWGSLPLAYFTSGTYFQHGDWESTARLQTDAYGTVDGAYTSLPFGENLAGDDGSQDDGGGPANQDARHFAGLDHDFETDTDHATYRQYAPNQGRWLSPDPYDGSYDFSNPQSFNRYAYVLNNPLTYTDPDGLQNDDPYSGGGDDCTWCNVIADAFRALVDLLFRRTRVSREFASQAVDPPSSNFRA